MHLSRQSFIILSACIFICLLGWTIQTHLFLNWDVSYLLHETEILFQGGTYANDLFEINPPLILYLYAPATFMSQWTGLNITFVFRIYILILTIGSLITCYRLAIPIFKNKN